MIAFKTVIKKSLSALIVIFVLVLALYFFIPQEYKTMYLQFIGSTVISFLYLIIIVDLIFLLGTVHGAIYYPSSNKQIATIIKFANIQKGEKAVDIGSGDGRVVFALAQASAEAHGYEINPF